MSSQHLSLEQEESLTVQALTGTRRMENLKRINVDVVQVSDSLLEKIKSYYV